MNTQTQILDAQTAGSCSIADAFVGFEVRKPVRDMQCPCIYQRRGPCLTESPKSPFGPVADGV